VLTKDGDNWREHVSSVLLADGKIHVQNGDNAASVAVPYEDVLSIAYSRGRDPMWNAPAGPQAIAKAGGGAFGIFHGTRHWVSIRTTNGKGRFLVLRLGNETQAKRAITLIEERTGRRAQAVANADSK
jgi:hypothetical protein